VYQYQKKAKKCKNLRSSGIASGSSALSYLTFVGAVITLGKISWMMGEKSNRIQNLTKRRRKRRHLNTSISVQ
jgi:hypothetical protein